MRNGGGHALTGQHRTGGESEGAEREEVERGGGDSDVGTSRPAAPLPMSNVQ